jgi:hypothetical protein
MRRAIEERLRRRRARALTSGRCCTAVRRAVQLVARLKAAGAPAGPDRPLFEALGATTRETVMALCHDTSLAEVRSPRVERTATLPRRQPRASRRERRAIRRLCAQLLADAIVDGCVARANEEKERAEKVEAAAAARRGRARALTSREAGGREAPAPPAARRR